MSTVINDIYYSEKSGCSMSLYQKIQFVIRKHTSCRDNERLSAFTGLLVFCSLPLVK